MAAAFYRVAAVLTPSTLMTSTRSMDVSDPLLARNASEPGSPGDSGTRPQTSERRTDDRSGLATGEPTLFDRAVLFGGLALVGASVDLWSKEAILAEHFSADVPFLKRGFRESPEDDIICRMRLPNALIGRDLLVDFMPDDEAILNFTNRWYRDALQTATEVARVFPGQFPLR